MAAKTGKKTKAVRIRHDLYEFIKSTMQPMEHFDDALMRLLPDPDGDLVWVVNKVVFTDFNSARVMAEELKSDIEVFQKL